MSTDAAPLPPLPAGVRPTTRHGADALEVDTPAASAVLHLDGAHLTSWRPAGEEDVLWTSPDSGYGPGVPIRGGIPLVGPWFGPGRHGDRPVKHGWLRTVRWDLREARTGGDAPDGGVVLVLTTPPGRQDLSATLTVRIGRELSLDLTLTAGEAALEVETALHTYLAVGDVRRTRLEGLGGSAFLDNTRGLARAVLPEGDLRPEGPTDRIVESAATVVLVDEAAGRRIVQTPRGTARTVVWTPWAEGAAAMEDIPDDGWTGFLCVEPAIAKDAAVTLAPGASVGIGADYRVER